MKSFSLLENLEFNDKSAHAQPLLVSDTGRILRFTLQPGQSLKEHKAPHSPVYLIVIKGNGYIGGSDGEEQAYGPNMMATFEPGEMHSARAEGEEFVFLAILHQASRD